jgi:hypothetical protein
MKTLILAALLLLPGLNAIAQAACFKAYAYSQATIPGIREEVVDDSHPGDRPSRPFPVQYYIYAEIPTACKVSLRGVWINGTYYKAALKKVKTPVLLEDPSVPLEDKAKKVLVKKTKNPVYRLILQGDGKMPSNLKAEKAIMDANQVILFFNRSGKAMNVAVKTITVLEPIHAM